MTNKIFPVTGSLVGDPWPPTGPSKVEVLEPSQALILLPSLHYPLFPERLPTHELCAFLLRLIFGFD